MPREGLVRLLEATLLFCSFVNTISQEDRRLRHRQALRQLQQWPRWRPLINHHSLHKSAKIFYWKSEPFDTAVEFVPPEGEDELVIVGVEEIELVGVGFRVEETRRLVEPLLGILPGELAAVLGETLIETLMDLMKLLKAGN